MAQELHVEIRGTRELQAGMRRLAANIDDATKAAFQATADQTATLVRSRVPRKSGRLAASVTGEPKPGGAAVTMGAGVPYAGWIEFGGGHGRTYLATGRYLNPTALQAAPAFQRAGENACRKQIGAMRWPTPSPL